MLYKLHGISACRCSSRLEHYFLIAVSTVDKHSPVKMLRLMHPVLQMSVASGVYNLHAHVTLCTLRHALCKCDAS